MRFVKIRIRLDLLHGARSQSASRAETVQCVEVRPNHPCRHMQILVWAAFWSDALLGPIWSHSRSFHLTSSKGACAENHAFLMCSRCKRPSWTKLLPARDANLDALEEELRREPHQRKNT